ncbi:hypothetical protein AYI70_g6506, partial [Smittium culicis]
MPKTNPETATIEA